MPEQDADCGSVLRRRAGHDPLRQDPGVLRGDGRARADHARHRWKLKDSYQTLVGNLHEVYDVWEVPSPDTVTTGLAAAQADPRFAGVAVKLAASVESETITLTTKTPFSP